MCIQLDLFIRSTGKVDSLGGAVTGYCVTTFHTNMCLIFNGNRDGKGKGKAVPLQAWSGPEGSRKLRFPDFMTTAQEGG